MLQYLQLLFDAGIAFLYLTKQQCQIHPSILVPLSWIYTDLSDGTMLNVK